ncbi:MAG: hypothetical protein BJ554DRAFT_1962, partial [Olpidium bornovanus]
MTGATAAVALSCFHGGLSMRCIRPMLICPLTSSLETPRSLPASSRLASLGSTASAAVPGVDHAHKTTGYELKAPLTARHPPRATLHHRHRASAPPYAVVRRTRASAAFSRRRRALALRLRLQPRLRRRRIRASAPP